MSIPVSRETAIRFLRGSVNGGAKPGDMLGPNLFKGPVRMPGLPAEFPLAMEFAAAQGWVEKLGPDQYRLTDAGFAVVQSDAEG